MVRGKEGFDRTGRRIKENKRRKDWVVRRKRGLRRRRGEGK